MRRKKAGRRGKAHILYLSGIIAAFAFLLLLFRSDVAIEYMKKGLKLCADTVIPSLFPFMVISELLVSSGLGDHLGKTPGKPIQWLFGVGEGGACAFLLGAICGFPIGAKVLCSMEDRGMISKRELSRALTFCNNPGSAFVISAVGVSLFGNLRLGILLYACVLLSAIIVGAMGRLFFHKSGERFEKAYEVAQGGRLDAAGTVTERFTEVIRGSAQAMMTVCALVTFFSSLVGCLGSVLEQFGLPRAITACIFGFFELSSGVGMAAEAYAAELALILCAAFCGWSGLSVHFQVLSICAGRGINFMPYFIAKGAQGLVCATLMGLALKALPFSEDAFADISVSVYQSTAYSNAAFICLMFFGAAVLPIILHRLLSLKRK